MRDEPGSPEGPAEREVVRHEDEMAGVDAVWRGAGHVRARKLVDDEHVSETHSRRVESVELRSEPASAEDSGRIETLEDGSISIPVFEEELVVTKRTVLRERVIVRKQTSVVEERVRATLRKERVRIDADEGIEVSGDRSLLGSTGRSRRRSVAASQSRGRAVPACDTTTAEVEMVESSTLQKAARLVGIVFLIVGILGFIPGITEDAPGDFAGEDSEGSLFGVFQTSILHNLVHLLFGVAGVALSRTWEGSRNFLLGGGAIYLGLWVVGLLGAMDWLPADDTDDWLHLALGAGMIALGLLFRGGRPGARSESEAARA